MAARAARSSARAPRWFGVGARGLVIAAGLGLTTPLHVQPRAWHGCPGPPPVWKEREWLQEQPSFGHRAGLVLRAWSRRICSARCAWVSRAMSVARLLGTQRHVRRDRLLAHVRLQVVLTEPHFDQLAQACHRSHPSSLVLVGLFTGSGMTGCDGVSSESFVGGWPRGTVWRARHAPSRRSMVERSPNAIPT